jgi:hypothetical protein
LKYLANSDRISPRELARQLRLSPARLAELVSEGHLPKGRIAEDGRRYYTQKDLDFIVREWRSQTTGRFLMYTLPLILVLITLSILTAVEITYKIEESRVPPTPTVPFGYGAPPPQVYDPGTPWPTPSEITIPDSLIEYYQLYQDQLREEERYFEFQRSELRGEERPLSEIN